MYCVFDELPKQYVLFGRGTGPSEHCGNRYYRQLISKYTLKYHDKQTTRDEKIDLIKCIIDTIVIDRRGQFVRKLSKEEMKQVSHLHRSLPNMNKTNKKGSNHGRSIYVTVEYASVVEKTKQAFRYMQKKTSSKNVSSNKINDDSTIDSAKSTPLVFSEPSSTKSSCHTSIAKPALTVPKIDSSKPTKSLPRYVMDPLSQVGGNGSCTTTTNSKLMEALAILQQSAPLTTTSSLVPQAALTPPTKSLLDLIYQKQLAYEMAVVTSEAIAIAEATILTNNRARRKPVEAKMDSPKKAEEAGPAPINSRAFLKAIRAP